MSSIHPPIQICSHLTTNPPPPTNYLLALPSRHFAGVSRHPASSESVDSMEVLTKYDQQLKTVIEHQDQLESQSVADARVIGLARQENAWTTFTTPSMWKRAIVLLVLMVVIVPVAVYKLYPQNHQS